MNTSILSVTARVVGAAIGLAFSASVVCAPEPEPAIAHGLDVAGVDRSVQPGADFFAFANGSWVKTAQIPPDRSAYGNGAILVEITNKRTAALIQEAGAHGASQSVESRQVGDYY